jgi:hypothetical protein
VWFVGELEDTLGDGRADPVDRRQFLLACSLDFSHVPELPGQDLCHVFAHVADAEGEEQALQRRVLRAGDSGDQVFRGLVGKALELEELLLRDGVQIGRVPDQPCIQELGDDLVAEAFDVHPAAGDEVPDVLPDLGGAGQIDAAVRHFALEPHDLRAADGAFLGHPVRFLTAGPPAFDDLDDFGDHISCPLHDDGVADADVLLGDLVLVVQGCPAHRDAAHLDGLHDGNGGPRQS